MKLPTTAVALICAAIAFPSAAMAHHRIDQSQPDIEPDRSAITEDAMTVRELNMMLMATSLRCRAGRFDFRREYEEFSRYNLKHLNSASDQVRREMSTRFGETNAARAMERFDADMANRYGSGHPSMNCAKLRDTAIHLAQPHDALTLVNIAWGLLYPE